MKLSSNPSWPEIEAWMSEGAIEQKRWTEDHIEKYFKRVQNLKYLEEIKAIRLRLTLAIIADILK